MKTYSGWFIVSEDRQIFIRKRADMWIRCPKRGIPQGAHLYATQAEAEREIGFMQRSGLWPLLAPGAHAELRTWK